MDDVTLVQEFCEGVLIGVFDGHGGREASEYVSQHFAEVLQTHLEEDFEVAMKLTFEELHESILSWCIYCGTTACVCYLRNNALVVANAGDTRCVLWKKDAVKRISIDHKPDLPCTLR